MSTATGEQQQQEEEEEGETVVVVVYLAHVAPGSGTDVTGATAAVSSQPRPASGVR